MAAFTTLSLTAISPEDDAMQAKYFEDTDTLFIKLSDRPPAQTRDISENLSVDLDDSGHVVSLTVEHARADKNKVDFSYELVGK
jgi:uncharacterized protein YuzE